LFFFTFVLFYLCLAALFFKRFRALTTEELAQAAAAASADDVGDEEDDDEELEESLVRSMTSTLTSMKRNVKKVEKNTGVDHKKLMKRYNHARKRMARAESLRIERSEMERKTIQKAVLKKAKSFTLEDGGLLPSESKKARTSLAGNTVNAKQRRLSSFK